ncbi:stage V sporulation protein AD [uncultured Flavonifractor sp.]|uniref:Stage V sporulation protein AD n=1 Tax=Candidatus Flavonifractor intestinigallinarum TaxID=2838586 RepID=A0A9D2SAU0_9FIRM|nr:stage V sporulation protein AD [Flavonifractor sp. An112]HIZ93122.1 stage V sporulation protein AD [Candidatus Flavonifractor avicola]HJB79866.1 stage V sporulation protein AD [Candidatus Flavonifractor intestinigallinarum]
MANKKLGRQTVALQDPPSVIGSAAVVGKKEGEGPLAATFDHISQDDSFGERSWEKAESAMQKLALAAALSKAGLSVSGLDYLLAGDLLNQCIGSGFAVRGQDVPFLGLYGACSTMAESLSLASMLLDGGYGTKIAAMTSSHFCSAERQYRSPLEYGGQRTPTAQWTVTGSGCVILADQGPGPYITHVTTGKVVDKGIKDAANMGAAMAPAAYSTLSAHFQDTGRKPSDYDLIVTGDLGQLGRDIVADWFHRDGMDLKNFNDCGTLIYDLEGQDVHCGGSGCGCSAVVLAGMLLNGMAGGRWKRILFCGTGALLSPTSSQQGESIPAICHAVALDIRK